MSSPSSWTANAISLHSKNIVRASKRASRSDEYAARSVDSLHVVGEPRSKAPGHLVDHAQKNLVAFRGYSPQARAIDRDIDISKASFDDRNFVVREIQLCRETFDAVNPTGHGEDVAQSGVERLDARIEKIAVGIERVTAEAALTRERVFDGRAVVWDHPTERSRRTAIARNPAQELRVIGDRFEGRRRIERHKAEFVCYVELLENVDRANVLLDRDQFVQRFEPVVTTGFETHVREIEPCLAHFCEEIFVDRISSTLIFHTARPASPARCNSAIKSRVQRF